MIHATEKSLDELGGELPDDDKANVENALQELKDVLDSGDAEDIKAKTEALSQASMKMGEIAYRKAQEESAGVSGDDESTDDAATADASSSDDDVLEADFTDLEIEDDDDEKKSA